MPKITDIEITITNRVSIEGHPWSSVHYKCLRDGEPFTALTHYNFPISNGKHQIAYERQAFINRQEKVWPIEEAPEIRPLEVP